MKKTLLVAAMLAGFAGAAQAETSVTMYGIAATGLTYSKISGSNSHIGMTDGNDTGPGGSRWGLKGEEDLGNGLSAIFQLEAGFNLNSGQHFQNGRMFGRQAYVGLASADMGTVTLGRQYAFYETYIAPIINPFDTSYGTAGAWGAGDLGADINRLDNMIMYQTPLISGLQFGVGYSFNTDETALPTSVSTPTSEAFRGITTALTYTDGPLALGASFDQVRLPSSQQGVGANPTTANVFALAASYDFEVFKLHLGYGHATNGLIGPMFFNRDASYNSYQIGATVPVGKATNLLASWQFIDPKASGAENAQVYSLGVKYDLSKRTSLYAYGSYGRNFIVNAGYSYAAAGAGVDTPNSTTATVGISHQF